MLNLKQKMIFSLFLLMAFLVPSSVHAAIFSYDELAKTPILDHGRVKPLDSFARSYLKGFSGKDTAAGMSATEWLMELMFDQGQAYRREIFNIPNPQVVDALELERREKHRYSYNEVSQAIVGHFKAWHSLFMKPKEELTLEQEQIVTLYNKTQIFADISRSFSLMFPEFLVPAGPLSDILGVEPGVKLTYMDIRKKDNDIQELSKLINDRMRSGSQELNVEEAQMSLFLQKADQIAGDKNSNTLLIIPSPWEDQQGQWFSPWGIGEQGYGSPQSAEFLKLWKELIAAYRHDDANQWAILAQKIRAASLRMAGNSASKNMLTLEVVSNRLQLFAKSFVLYLTAFILIMASFLFWPKILQRGAFLFLLAGFLTHTSGIVMRMVIMHRPPVTSLYESILFVSFISVLFGLILELRKRNSIGIIIAACVGAFLHFLGIKYDTDGDTMGMLAAVLNTNFWLATHVVTITIGYGCCLVGGIISHVYMILRLLKPKDRARLEDLYNNLRGVSIVALFFAVLGTILGGIWADQSWGRFWGWDPKENGALLIVLWLAWLIHGRISGKLGELGFVTGMVCTNIVVALAWFGVNLLSVGLHSYGFTQNAATNLFVFCAVEVSFALGCYFIIKFRK